MAQAEVQTTQTSTSVSVSNMPTDMETYEMEDIDPEIAADIMEDWDKNREEVEKYKKSKNNICDTDTNPVLVQVEKLIYPTLRNFLIELLHEALGNDCCYRPRTCFDGIDFLSESLYNSNTKDPTRSNPWKYIFDLDWVVEYLESNPRPYFPLSLLMSRDTAARYIQAHVRGFWVRSRVDLREIRMFWKNIKFRRTSTSRLSIVLISEAVTKSSRSKVAK